MKLGDVGKGPASSLVSKRLHLRRPENAYSIDSQRNRRCPGQRSRARASPPRRRRIQPLRWGRPQRKGWIRRLRGGEALARERWPGQRRFRWLSMLYAFSGRLRCNRFDTRLEAGPLPTSPSFIPS
eukprot:gene42040-52112_t